MEWIFHFQIKRSPCPGPCEQVKRPEAARDLDAHCELRLLVIFGIIVFVLILIIIKDVHLFSFHLAAEGSNIDRDPEEQVEKVKDRLTTTQGLVPDPG